MAKVEGTVELQHAISVERDGIFFEFRTDKFSTLNEIAVSVNVPRDKIGKFASSAKKGKGEIAASITIGGDKELHDKLTNELQILESNLAFASRGALKRIDWKTPKQKFIPEDPEEEKLVKISSFSYKSGYPDPIVTISPESLKKLVLTSVPYNQLYIPKAFWREGLRFYQSAEYVNAFYNFYFVIEDFYADGKTGSKEVLRAFARSQEFEKVARKVLQQVAEKKTHHERLVEIIRDENCSLDPQGLQQVLYRMRGNLHHYCTKGNKVKGTPFSHQEFETIAFVAMLTSTLAIGYREAVISQEIKTG